KATPRTPPWCPLKPRSSFPVSTSQSRTVSSPFAPDRKRRPSGEKAAHATEPLWPSKRRMGPGHSPPSPRVPPFFPSPLWPPAPGGLPEQEELPPPARAEFHGLLCGVDGGLPFAGARVGRAQHCPVVANFWEQLHGFLGQLDGAAWVARLGIEAGSQAPDQ